MIYQYNLMADYAILLQEIVKRRMTFLPRVAKLLASTHRLTGADYCADRSLGEAASGDSIYLLGREFSEFSFREDSTGSEIRGEAYIRVQRGFHALNKALQVYWKNEDNLPPDALRAMCEGEIDWVLYALTAHLNGLLRAERFDPL